MFDPSIQEEGRVAATADDTVRNTDHGEGGASTTPQKGLNISVTRARTPASTGAHRRKRDVVERIVDKMELELGKRRTAAVQ